MSSVSLLDKSRVEIKLGSYGVAAATAVSDPSILGCVQDYRRKASSRMQPLDRHDILKKMPTAEYNVSRKIDGEFTVLVFRNGEAFTMNPGGTVRIGIPWLDEASRLLSAAGVKDAMIAGELYVARNDRRARIHDVVTVARQPRTIEEVGTLRFAAFDILSLNGDASQRPFAETRKTIETLFAKGQMAHPVESRNVTEVAGISRLFEQWVDGEGAEGLVVRNDSAGLFKIKPSYTIDAVVIGFTESVDDRRGMMHDLLLALMRPEGTLQVLGRVGGGFTDDLRRDLLCDLKDMVVESEYAEVNSDHVAYQMVRPQWVIEISCLDIISQTTRGATVDRVVLDYQRGDSQRYNVVTRMPLATMISPQFVRRREDKSVTPQDIRIAQLTDVVDIPCADRDSRQMTLPASEILKREVYTKDLKGQTMVRKFLIWKTNKESGSDQFPAYVVHYTDFSPNRKDALQREIRVSSSLEQIESLFQGMKEANIKGGWQCVSTGPESGSGSSAPSAPADAVTAPPVAEEAKTPKKTRAKKAAAAATSDAAAAEESATLVAAGSVSESGGNDSETPPAPRKRTPRKKAE